MSLVIPICFFDPPLVIDTSVTPIPAISDSPLQVILNSGINTGVGVAYNDRTGDFIGVYIGNPGIETLCCIIGNGISGVSWGKIPANSRISLGSMSTSPITFGFIQATVVSA